MTPAKDILGEHAVQLITSLKEQIVQQQILMGQMLTNIGYQDHCKGCNGVIWWVQHKNGKNAPYDPSGLNHFATCPKADQFKKEKTK